MSMTTIMNDPILETHPFEPFLPPNSKVLIMGTFPPQPHRWSMKFYYPNVINDFWRIMGLIFFNNAEALWDASARRFREQSLRQLAQEKGIALHDTGAVIRRLAGNASDKFLDIVTPVNLAALLAEIPLCHHIATTGEKAAEVIARLTGSQAPKMGEWVQTDYLFDAPDGKPLSRQLYITRMPSTSRAYPMKLEKKAAYYKQLFIESGIQI